MAWDEEQEAADIRRRAGRARTEDEYLDILREAGSLAAGAAVLNYDRASQLTEAQRAQLSQLQIRENQRLAAQATMPVSDEVRAAHERHDAQVHARFDAFRVLGDGPAISREWRDAKGCYGPGPYDYEAAIAAELAARRREA
jgi:hypothetical protein